MPRPKANDALLPTRRTSCARRWPACRRRSRPGPTGHAWLLRELLGNLVDNAIRYTPAGGRVTLRCGWYRPDGETADRPFLEVEDNGPGVPPQERARMLERFYRIAGTQGEGTGLGLAIADEIARVHHSQLQVLDAHEGTGLRMFLGLPG
jgi:two-component system sensor histidine kinase TctE